VSQSNTLKTIVGYLKSLLQLHFPKNARNADIDKIYNYVPISDFLSTSGQPSAAEFKLIAAAGFKKVVNLAPHNAENAIADEPAILANLGVEYFHIPVDFRKPTEADFQQFSALMMRYSEQQVWVHCAANMRVSAFVYRYRRIYLGEDGVDATFDLNRIWKPVGVWRKFIDTVAE